MVSARPILFFGFLLIASVLVAAGSPSVTGMTTAQEAGGFAAATQVDADTILLRVDLQPDGSAAWRVEYRLRLDDENATAAFESLEADIERNRSEYEDRFARGMQQTVADAENTTGREMALGTVSVETTTTTLPQEYGVIVYEFVWAGFAVTDGDEIRAGDAIAGLFLDAETTLILGFPADYQVAEVTPEPDERREQAVVWTGRLDFADGEPRILVDQSAAPDTTTSGTGGPDGGDGDSGTNFPMIPLLAVIIVLAVGGLGGWVYLQNRSPPSTSQAESAASETGPPSDLLSNEERVLQLLEEHDGRIKQQEVATELDWTDAKTSQVVQKLRDEDEIEVFRLGRENVISLPDESEL